MVRRPPHFLGEVVCFLAERLYHFRKKDRFADRSRLRPEAVLTSLVPEGCKIRWGHRASDDLASASLKAVISAVKSLVRFW
jgi:hypothetical protein